MLLIMLIVLIINMVIVFHIDVVVAVVVAGFYWLYVNSRYDRINFYPLLLLFSYVCIVILMQLGSLLVLHTQS